MGSRRAAADAPTTRGLHTAQNMATAAAMPANIAAVRLFIASTLPRKGAFSFVRMIFIMHIISLG